MSSGWKFEVIQKTMEEADNQLSVSMLCETAGVSRSGYYRWVNAADIREEREKKDREDFELILKAYNQRGYSKGARGIYMCMVHWDPPIVMNVKKIRRLMDKYGLVCPIRKVSTVLDAYTRQVLSYVLSGSLEVDFVLETVEKLVRNHGIELKRKP